MAVSKKNMSVLFRTLGVLVSYLFYTRILGFIFNSFGLNDSVVQMFLADLIFLIAMIILYKKVIKHDFEAFKKEYKLSKKIKTILLWVIMIFLVNISMGILTDLFFPNASSSIDENALALYGLFNVSSIYTIFKTMIFAVVAEELVFKKAIRDIFSNNILFILVSGFIYVILNFIYTDTLTGFVLMDMLGYFLFSVITGLAYIKNNDNIFIVMLIKFFYNLVPLILMIQGM